MRFQLNMINVYHFRHDMGTSLEFKVWHYACLVRNAVYGLVTYIF